MLREPVVTLRVNGNDQALRIEPRRTLLDALRNDLGLTGAKKACDMGNCGACTVLVDGRAAYACLLLAIDCARIATGLGYALSEERIVDAARGLVLNANLEEYKVQTAADLPQILNATESMPDWEANDSGAKGIGEPPLIPTAAAIANAIFDAVGVRVRDLPCKRETFLL